MDKQTFAARAEREGWPVPKTATADGWPELEQATAAFTFPVILKPKVKGLAFSQNIRLKVFRCPDRAALRAAYQDMAQWEPGAVVQEWIPGGDDEVHFTFHYYSQSGQEISAFTGRKLRQYPPLSGNTSCAEPLDDPRLLPLSRSILTSCGAVSFCSVEYKRDPRTDRHLIMEPTIGRVNLQVGVAAANGVDLIGRAYCHLVGRQYPGAEPQPRRKVRWIYLAKDLRTARHYIGEGSLSWGGYLKSIAGPRVGAVWSWRDPGMALAVLPVFGRRVTGYLGRRLRRLLGGTRSE